jgi:hypothetical protein
MSNKIIEINGHRHVVWQCQTCGVIATCPEAVHDWHYAEGGYHFCPNGHQWGWSQQTCEREKLRRERDQLKQNQAYLQDQITAERVRTAAAQAATKRLKKRASAGTCPCCQRTFANMAAHMKTKHPELIREGGANVVPIKRAGRDN